MLFRVFVFEAETIERNENCVAIAGGPVSHRWWAVSSSKTLRKAGRYTEIFSDFVV